LTFVLLPFMVLRRAPRPCFRLSPHSYTTMV
jgi:hypothetical protein